MVSASPEVDIAKDKAMVIRDGPGPYHSDDHAERSAVLVANTIDVWLDYAGITHRGSQTPTRPRR